MAESLGGSSGDSFEKPGPLGSPQNFLTCVSRQIWSLDVPRIHRPPFLWNGAGFGKTLEAGSCSSIVWVNGNSR